MSAPYRCLGAFITSKKFNYADKSWDIEHRCVGYRSQTNVDPIQSLVPVTGKSASDVVFSQLLCIGSFSPKIEDKMQCNGVYAVGENPEAYDLRKMYPLAPTIITHHDMLDFYPTKFLLQVVERSKSIFMRFYPAFISPFISTMSHPFEFLTKVSDRSFEITRHVLSVITRCAVIGSAVWDVLTLQCGPLIQVKKSDQGETEVRVILFENKKSRSERRAQEISVAKENLEVKENSQKSSGTENDEVSASDSKKPRSS
eukprot:GDKJ01003578.1.p1 GENE.GDKJ01003578.1~~GDKJ01003578.1.p1  ORF type:complete len:257 (-),score=23.43 GDKJ01003578.1:137-907(-)